EGSAVKCAGGTHKDMISCNLQLWSCSLARPRKFDPVQSILRDLARELAGQFAGYLSESFAEAVQAPSFQRAIRAVPRPGPAPAGRRGGRTRGEKKPCAVAGCSRDAKTKGLCPNHYLKG